MSVKQILTLCVLVLLALLQGCADSIIAPSCREGFRASGRNCVSIRPDSGSDAAIDSGSDGGVLDGTVPDGGDDGSVGSDGGTDGGPPTDGGGTDSAIDAGVDAAVDAGVDGGTDAGVDAGCPTGFLECGTQCVDPNGSDPDNCGSCGFVCASGICLNGSCEDDLNGHVVMIGHDYTNSRLGMNRVAGNAIFLVSGTVEAIVYEGTATTASIDGVNQAIDQRAMEQTRAWNRTAVTAAQVPGALPSAGALVILPQPTSSDAELTQLGTDWSAAIAAFVGRGGSVVLFDTPSASNAGTWQILAAAGQFSGMGIVDVSLDNVSVLNLNDSVALDVPATYLGESSTVRFVTSETNVVIEHALGPVVLHRVIRP